MFHRRLILVLALLFVLELVVLPLPGIEGDEALFALPFLKGHPIPYAWGSVPVMLMDYVGALKSWIYWPVFKIWPIGIWSVRLPVCLLSLVTAGLFADLTRRVAGARAGLFAALLLATDPAFVLTNVFDWGPVCLLILGMVAVLSLMHRFFATGNRRLLVAAMFVAGLVTWYKPLLLVLFVAAAAAWLVVRNRKSRFPMMRDTIFAAVPAFLLGAAPLIAFNAQHHLATLQAPGYLPRVAVSEKILMMRRTLDGRALEHYMFRSFPGEKIALSGAPIADLVESWYRPTNFHPGSLLFPAFLLSLLAIFFLRGSEYIRPLLFAWLAWTAAFGAMLLFRDAGAGPHHTVLLDPAPQFIVTLTAVGLEKRFRTRGLATLLIGVIVISNLWLFGQYVNAGRENGFSVYWTDGIANLANQVEAAHLPAAFLDWGVENGVQTMSADRLPVADSIPPRAGVLYVTHCEGYVIDGQDSQAFRQALLERHLSMIDGRTITDREGEPVFCTFRLSQER